MHRQLFNMIQAKTAIFSVRTSLGFAAIVIAGIIIASFCCSNSEDNGNLETGKEYCIILSGVAVSSTNKRGALWDSDNTAPDLFAKMYIDKAEIYRSSIQNNTCTARWQQRENKWGKMLSEGTIKAALCGGRITVSEDQTLSVAVYDSDFLSEEFIGVLVIWTHSLHRGKNIFQVEQYPENVYGRIKSIELTVIEKDENE